MKKISKEFLKKILPLKLIEIYRIILLFGIKFKKKQFEIKEAKQILRKLDNGIKNNVLIIYDTFVSPPTFGDYLYVVMFARYFTSQGIRVNFIIVDGEYRSDWHSLNKDESKNLVKQYVYIANQLLNPKLAIVEVLTSSQLKINIQKDNYNETFIPFHENINNRLSIYNHISNLISYLLRDSNINNLDSFLLSYKEFEGKYTLNTPKQPYITFGCRYSSKWGFDRNLTDEEFLKIYPTLKLLYPHHAVMVVSDTDGCNHFKKVANQHSLNCLFCKEYSDTFLGDAELILGSEYYFILKGGGISFFPIFSLIPYELVMNLINETSFSAEKLYPWSSEKQICRSYNKGVNILPTLGIAHRDISHGSKFR